MIRTFIIQNFRSIKDNLEINMEASALAEGTFFENTFDLKSSKYLKTISFYGENASGKTNIVKAFAALKELIVPLPGGPVLPYYPFIFSNRTKLAPTYFSIEFSLDNNPDSTLYRYKVSYDSKFVLYESFEKLTSQKYSLIFTRNTDENGLSKLDFGSSIASSDLLHALKNSIVPSKTFLSMFSSFKINDFYDAYQFFSMRLVNISPEINRAFDIVPDKFISDEGLQQFTLKLLKSADFNIDGFHIGDGKHPKIVLNGNTPSLTQASLFIQHKGNIDNNSLEFVDESLGTKKMFLLAEYLYPVFSKPSVMIIDELESSLHSDLTKFIVTCFLDETLNRFNSQLIFTSHETSLLNLNLLRRDQIYFVYKDNQYCSTYIACLKDFHLRKTDNVEKSYLSGRFSTSPDVNSIYLENHNA